jgi:hypothetical protein
MLPHLVVNFLLNLRRHHNGARKLVQEDLECCRRANRLPHVPEFEFGTLGDLHWLPPTPTGGWPGRLGLSDTRRRKIPAVQALPPLVLGGASGDPLMALRHEQCRKSSVLIRHRSQQFLLRA